MSDYTCMWILRLIIIVTKNNEPCLPLIFIHVHLFSLQSSHLEDKYFTNKGTDFIFFVHDIILKVLVIFNYQTYKNRYQLPVSFHSIPHSVSFYSGFYTFPIVIPVIMYNTRSTWIPKSIQQLYESCVTLFKRKYLR